MGTGQLIRNKRHAFVEQTLVQAGEDVLVFYNDRGSFNSFVKMMKSERHRMDESSPLKYHVELVKLLACCTMGKNVNNEIKCHSLLPLDDIVLMVSHQDCIPEVKQAYINFLNHCYIDTEVEMKEIYTSNHMWSLFEKSFIVDMSRIASATQDRQHAGITLENYVTNCVMNIITTFFNSPFSDQSTTVHPCGNFCIQPMLMNGSSLCQYWLPTLGYQCCRSTGILVKPTIQQSSVPSAIPVVATSCNLQ